MSNKKFKFKAVPLGGSAPTPGSTGNETYTLFAKQLTSTTFTPIVTDGNGKALEMVTSSGGGGTPTPAVTPTLSQVLSAGNTLDGKEISGDLRVVNEELTAAGSKNLEFVIRDNNLEFYSRELTHRENLEFRASLSDLHYESHVENGDTFGLHLADNGYDINIPNKNSGISSSTLNLKFDSLTGLYSSEIFPVTEDGQFIQKKYLDDKLAGLSTGGGGTGTNSPQTLSQVLTAGNTLDDKEIVGRFKLKNSLAVGRDYTYNITENGLNYSHNDLNDSFNYDLNTHGILYNFNDEHDGVTFNSSFTVDRGGVTFGSDGTSHESGIDFKATKDSGLRFSTWKKDDVDSSYFAFDSNKLEVYSSVNGENNTFYVDSKGAYAEEYKEPVSEFYYVQKKYVDSLLEGGKIDVTVDRMYLTYGGKLAVDITVNGLPSNKVADTGLFDHSTFRMEVANGTSSTRAFFTFGPTGNATIEKTYLYYETGTVKAHIEAVLSSAAVDSWGVPNPGKDIFNKTRGFFVYIPEAGMPFNKGVRSRMTHYGEVYDKRQSGVVNFKLQDGKKSTIVPSTEEYKFFAFDADTFKAEDPIDSTYSYFINNGIPIGSQDVQSGYILSNNRIMPNPTPNQVTEWELTFKLGGEDASRITNILDYMVVVYDSENNPLEHVHFDFFNDSAGEVATARAKLTTINKFKNIVGNGRGFKFGIKINRGILDLNYDVKFELVNIKRTSRALV